MDGLFEFLFKYRPLVFREGDFTFAAPWSLGALVVAVALTVALTALSYSRATGDTETRDRIVMGTLRLLAVGTILTMVLRPMLVLQTVVPQQNFIGVLIDDSESMLIRDATGASRSDFIFERFGADGSRLMSDLEEKFTVRFFGFDRSLSRLSDISELEFEGTRTNVGGALERAQEELAGVPLSGLVLFTDGADNSDQSLAESLVPLQAASLPVYTVGLGEPQIDPDIQVSRVDVPRTVLQGTSLAVDVTISHHGFRGRKVPLVVEDAGRIIASEEVELAGNGEPVIHRVLVEADAAGPRLLRFRVPVQNGERVAQNNSREVLVDVRDQREKILYFEGELRWELKFLRRAVADDKNLQVVVLQRTAENKFLRLDVDDPEELQAGFPRTREELFRYRSIILGSVEASFFTHDQMQMIADFVSERGGGLLVLGGRKAFAQGGYSGTPIEDALPVLLDDELGAGADEGFFSTLKVSPTRAGLTHPAVQLWGSDGPTEERFAALPALTSLNPITRLKPGATALLIGTDVDSGAQQVVLAHHRYGRGKVVAFPVQDSWMWQMHADVPLDDMTHEMFWRQALRWLVDGVPDMVIAQVEQETVAPGQAVRLVARIADSAFVEANDANVVATIHPVEGAEYQIPLDWTVEENGEYAATFTAKDPGLYSVDIRADRRGESLGVATTYAHATRPVVEYFDASMRETTLRRIAEQTGGQFYTPETVDRLPEDISFTGAGVTLTEERELWDMPVLLMLVLVLIGSEWAYRRARGLV
jgi:uncharacterized membrane protein